MDYILLAYSWIVFAIVAISNYRVVMLFAITRNDLRASKAEGSQLRSALMREDLTPVSDHLVRALSRSISRSI